jgi:GDPmannose 4,6-dehydratase
MPTALITGVGGQDGSYLAEFLLARDYRVIGTTRDAHRTLESPHATALAGIELVVGEINSPSNPVLDAIKRERPDEVYHLAGPSHVGQSWSDPVATQTAIALSTYLLLDAVMEDLPSPRVFFAGSSEIFAPGDAAQDESAARGAQSPYAEGKLLAMQFVEKARQQGGLYAVTGILFNHESPRRGESFVTRKIARAAARIARRQQERLTLGNLDVRRDWGFAGDYVRAMWLMMFQDEPEDLVIGTGVAHSVAEFCDVAFRRAGLDWREHVDSDPSLFRPSDAPLRQANPARAKSRLGWTPEVDFQRLVEIMVDHELQELDASS